MTKGKLFEEQLEERKAYLEELILQTEKAGAKYARLPEARVRIQKKGNSYQYYWKDAGTDETWKYLANTQLHKAEKIIQKGYLDRVLVNAKKELVQLNHYLAKSNPAALNQIYENYPEGRKRVVTPIEETDEEFVSRWKAVEYKGLRFEDDITEFYTDKNERVRSKSEVIIANLLTKYGVPYRYEYPIKLKDGQVVHPDFIGLNVKRRKEILLEHFGLLDNDMYMENAIRKLKAYEKSGYHLGDNLMITYETGNCPLDLKNLQEMLKRVYWG